MYIFFSDNIQCQYCKKSYKDANELEKHIEQMHVSVSCSECNKIFKNRRNLLSHEQLVHEKKKRYFCSHCGKGYYYKSEMKSHEKNVSINAIPIRANINFFLCISGSSQ